MIEFTITDIHGDQLVQEIEAALGIYIGDFYSFVPPDALEIHGFDAYEAQIAPIVAAHVPRLDATPEGAAIQRQLESKAVYSTLPIAGMTPIEAGAWAQAGVTDLVTARDIISILAQAVICLADHVDKLSAV